MKAWTRVAALGAAFALALPFAAAAEEAVWENPDGSPAGQVAPGEPPSVATDGDEQAPTTAPAQVLAPTPEVAPQPAPEVVLQPAPEVKPQPVLQELPQPDRKKRRRVKARIPPGHMPPPGFCRIWFPDRPPGHQPPPGPCEALEPRVPPGAFIVRG